MQVFMNQQMVSLDMSFFVPEALIIFAAVGAAFKALVNWRKRAGGDARAPLMQGICAGAKYY